MRNTKFSVTKEIIANETLQNESSKIHTKLIKRTEYPQELSTISQKYKKFLCSINKFKTTENNRKKKKLLQTIYKPIWIYIILIVVPLKMNIVET